MAGRLSSGALLAAGASAFVAASASGAVNWTNPSGNGAFFTYSGGGSDLGLFGDPTLINGHVFQFNPPAFETESTGGVETTVTDRLFVTLTANPGHRFESIRVVESGGWSIAGVGFVSNSGALTLTDLLTVRLPVSDALDSNPTMPITAPQSSGDWSSAAFIDLTQVIGADWTKLQLVFVNNLQAGGDISSEIQKTGMSIIILPAPGAAAVLGLAGLVVSRRRR